MVLPYVALGASTKRLSSVSYESGTTNLPSLVVASIPEGTGRLRNGTKPTPFGFRHFNEFARRHRADLTVKHTGFDYASQSFAAAQSVAPLDSTSRQLGCVSAWNKGSDAILVQSRSRGTDETGLKQVQLGTSVHLTLIELELGDLALGLSVGP